MTRWIDPDRPQELTPEESLSVKERVQRGPRLQKVEIYLLADQVDLSTR
jgi:hypothetical protein